MIPIHFTTTTGAVVWKQIPTYTELWGIVATDAKDATYYVRVFWQGNSNKAPVAGTTAPTITFAIQSGSVDCIFVMPIILQGPMYYNVSLDQGDTDTTVLSTGGDVVTLLVA